MLLAEAEQTTTFATGPPNFTIKWYNVMHFYPGAAQVNKKELHRKCAQYTGNQKRYRKNRKWSIINYSMIPLSSDH